MLSRTPDGFLKEYEVVDPSDLRHPSAVVSFEKIMKQNVKNFNYAVFGLCRKKPNTARQTVP